MKAFHKKPTEPTLLSPSATTSLPRWIGPYKVEALINRGGMGWLYMGLHPETRQPLAIKVLPVEHNQNQAAIDLFLQEAQIIAKTDHPHIVKLYGEGTWEQGLYIAMEWIRGVSLRQFLHEQSLSLKRSIEIIIQIAKALEHLHAHGIIHRDLKPENVLISEEGIVKIIDFGIAHIIDSQTHVPDQIVGTPHYMSPEQKQSPKHISFASDIYSLGVLSYELLVGKTSYGILPTSLLPPKLSAIIQKAIAISLEERYPTIQAFLQDLLVYRASRSWEKERPISDAWIETQEILQSLATPLTPTSLPSHPTLELGIAKNRIGNALGLYYEGRQLPDHSYLLFFASPSEQNIQGLYRIQGLRGWIHSYLSLVEKMNLSSFCLALLPLLQEDPFCSFSCLHIDPSTHSVHYGSIAAAPLILAKAGQDPQLLVEAKPTQFAIHHIDWTPGDILCLHTLPDYGAKELLLALTKHRLLSAQSQAEALFQEPPIPAMVRKEKKQQALFIIQYLP